MIKKQITLQMREKHMFASSSIAGAVAAAVSCFFIGCVLLIWSIWDMSGKMNVDILAEDISLAIGISIVIWLSGWFCLHQAWKQRHISRVAAHKVISALISVGVGSTIFTMIRIFVT